MYNVSGPAASTSDIGQKGFESNVAVNALYPSLALCSGLIIFVGDNDE
ncbi:hypothetical protein Bhyg_16089 [Pseudolycoriella hygida]|uniref:Uncharacterized protein n=1 Tax=Pseudolycoriella hygida TaxID=35572 RepID=A0A9Q0RVG7_9DIPT|nr:hypothetical protein Bhyg_16089 [Pseudolycoriella hygida]